MFQRIKSMMNSDLNNSINNKNNSSEPLNFSSSSSLSHYDEEDSKPGRSSIVWQKGSLQETISYYDKAIAQNPRSAEPYQQLLIHLKQQNTVAETYKRIAQSLQNQGNNEEAAICYHKASIIKAVIKEVTAKYKDVINKFQSNYANNGVRLTNDAFSFQRAIKEQTKTHLLQIELPQNYIATPTPAPKIKKLNEKQIAEVEWETAQMFMQKALEFCDRQKWSEVAQACSQATSIMPQMAEAYKIWGNALQRLNRTAEAMEYYRKAVEIQPDLAEVYAGIAKLYSQQQKWQQAVEYYQKAIIIKPEFPRAYRNLANVWEQLGELEKAKVCIQRGEELEANGVNESLEPDITEDLLQKQSNSPEITFSEPTIDDSIFTCHEMAQDFEQKNLWREAAIYYRQALELDLSQQLITSEIAPKDKQQHIASQQSRVARIQKLLASSETMILEDASSNNDSVRDLATVRNKSKTIKLDSQNSLDTTIKRYQRKAKLKPNSASIQIDLGDLYTRKKSWSNAVVHYTKAIRINPKNAIAHVKLAKAAAKSGDSYSYIDHMYLAYRLQPSLGSAEDHFLLADTLRKVGNRTRAIFCYEQAIKIQPNFNEAYRRLGKLFQETGKLKNAIACYQEAIKYSPEDAYFYYTLGRLQATQGFWDDAVKAYLKVLEIQPQYPQASQRLNHALSKKLKQDLAGKYSKQDVC